jgi:hypothetical protein
MAENETARQRKFLKVAGSLFQRFYLLNFLHDNKKHQLTLPRFYDGM